MLRIMTKYFKDKNYIGLLAIVILLILIIGIYWGVKSSFKNKDQSLRIKAEELKEKIDRSDNFILIDLRSDIEYRKDHIPKAISIPIFDLTEKSKDLPKDASIIVYCGGEDCKVSEQAQDKLKSLDFKNVKIFAGGYLEWIDKNYPLTKEINNIASLKPLPILVVITGLTDGINPCAIGILLFLLGYLIIFKDTPEKTKIIGGAYIVVTFLTYLLLGFFLFNSLALLTSTSYRKAGLYVDLLLFGILFFAASINLKDYFFYGKGITLQIPQKTRGLLNRLVEVGTLPATIILAFFVTFFETPCSLPLYVGILRVLNETVASPILTLSYLLLYNLMFVLPLIIILGLVIFGEKMVYLKEWEHKNKRKMKLGMGLVQLALAFWIILR